MIILLLESCEILGLVQHGQEQKLKAVLELLLHTGNAHARPIDFFLTPFVTIVMCLI
jgi:hypothetical protein